MLKRNTTPRFSRKNIISLLFCLAALSLGFQSTNGQRSDFNAADDTLGIKQQFDYIFEKSRRYEEYKVIRESWLTTFNSNFEDSLVLQRNLLNETQQELQTEKTRNDSLNNALAQATSEKDLAIKNKDSLKVFGIRFSKSLYQVITWGLVFLLAALLIVFYGVLKRNLKLSGSAKTDLDELSHEFEEYKKASRLKMEKVKREHLNEVMKLKSSR